MRQIFQRVQILHQHIFPGECHNAGSKSDADQQVQALGQHTQQSGGGSDNSIVKAVVPHQVRLQEQEHTQRHDKETRQLGDLPHREHQLRVDRLGFLCLSGDFGSVVIAAHVDDLRTALSADDRAAGEQRIPRLLQNGVRLTSQEGLVDLHRALHHCGIGANLLTAVQQQDVLQFDLLHGDLLHLAVSHHLCLGRRKQGELLNQTLCLDLLRNANNGIERNDKNKEQVGPCVNVHQRNGDEQIQQVEQRTDVFPQNLPGRLCDFLLTIHAR